MREPELSNRICLCDVYSPTIDGYINEVITQWERHEKEKKDMLGTPEVTPVETGSIPERANPAV
jgi:hypothetical protein